jgi:N-acetylglucosaminyldiphosphoundecaprenol N-acetyl-beta-D-mannosaminyltransferase
MIKSTTKMDHKYDKILNIGVNSTSVVRVLTYIRDSLARHNKFYIVTPNPEIVLEASHDLELLKIINRADLSIPDGTGLLIAKQFLGMKMFSKPFNYFVYPIEWFIASVEMTLTKGKHFNDPLTLIKGRKLFLEIMKLANSKNLRVYFFGGEAGEAIKSKDNLEKTFKSVKIKAVQPGMYNKSGEPVTESDITKEIDIVKDINSFKPHLLFVALNTPKQEKWIERMLPKLDIGGAMTIGGTLNYVAGNSKLPPKWIGDSGFEWLWRLVTEPKRFRRVFNAFMVFPFKVMASKINIL